MRATARTARSTGATVWPLLLKTRKQETDKDPKPLTACDTEQRMKIVLILIATLFTKSTLADEPTVWVAAGCYPGAVGATQQAALVECRKGDRKMRREHGNRACDCAKSQLIALHGKVAYFHDRYCYYTAPRLEAIHEACAANPKSNKERCCQKVDRIYGPFARRPVQPVGFYDNINTFRWLGTDGSWYDEKGESPCFAAGTLVATPLGERAIETIVAGDLVTSWDGTLVTARVTHTKRRRAELLVIRFADGQALRVTDNHPLAVRGGWRQAGELIAGDRVFATSGSELVEWVVAKSEHEPGFVEVYDLTVEPTHSYFAGGILAHNY